MLHIHSQWRNFSTTHLLTVGTHLKKYQFVIAIFTVYYKKLQNVINNFNTSRTKVHFSTYSTTAHEFWTQPRLITNKTTKVKENMIFNNKKLSIYSKIFISNSENQHEVQQCITWIKWIMYDTGKVWSYWKKKLHRMRATGDFKRFSVQSAACCMVKASEVTGGARGLEFTPPSHETHRCWDNFSFPVIACSHTSSPALFGFIYKKCNELWQIIT